MIESKLVVRIGACLISVIEDTEDRHDSSPSTGELFVNDLDPDHDSYWRDPVWVGDRRDAQKMFGLAKMYAETGLGAEQIEDLFSSIGVIEHSDGHYTPIR